MPIKNDPVANERRSTKCGRTSCAKCSRSRRNLGRSSGLVPIAKEIFDAYMKEANQILEKPEDVHVTATDLLAVPGARSPRPGCGGISTSVCNISILAARRGCVPIYNLMEDAATAEIGRAQVWQWVKHGAKLSDGTTVTAEMVGKATDESGGGKFEEGCGSLQTDDDQWRFHGISHAGRLRLYRLGSKRNSAAGQTQMNAD